jgi:hypothetical protein
MMVRFTALVSLTLLSGTQVSCYNTKPLDRRSLFGALVAASCVASTCTPAVAADAVVGVLSSKYCAGGVGEGCEDRAEGNEFIKTLREKSAENREANSREALNAFYMKNYPDFFASTGKKLVKKPDGGFAVFSEGEFSQLKQENKIGLEIPKTKGGKYQDLTQKPILVLKE